MPLPNDLLPPAPNYSFRHGINVPADLRDSMRRTIAFALDFILDTLYSHDEPSVPANEADL
jgi:E3 ubiquitin-protein ligase UBR1